MISELKIFQSKKNKRIIWKCERQDNINGYSQYYLLTDLKGNYIAKNIDYNKIFIQYIKGILNK